jgi:hypothetical protein
MPRIFIGFHMVLLMVLTLYGTGCSHVQLASASKVEGLEKRIEALENSVQNALEQQPEGNGAYTIVVSRDNMPNDVSENWWLFQEIAYAASLEHVPFVSIEFADDKQTAMLRNYILITALNNGNLDDEGWRWFSFDIRTESGPVKQIRSSEIPRFRNEVEIRGILRDSFAQIRQIITPAEVKQPAEDSPPPENPE